MTISFKRLTETDLPLLTGWLNRPHVAERWDTRAARSLEDVRQKYLPRMANGSTTIPYLAYRDGVPIGYIQSYVAMHCGDGWWPDERDPGVRGIDQFLADANNLGHGVGTEMVRAFVRDLFRDRCVTRVQADPAPDNLRAIRCYEKAGFRKVETITTPDGAALLMVVDRD